MSGRAIPAQLSELAAATQRLLQILTEQGYIIEGVQVRLATKPSTLLVLAEHSEAELLQPRQLIPIFESVLRALLAELPFPDTLGQTLAERQQINVRLFLRHIGKDRPYKTYSFIWKASDALSEVFGESTQTVHPRPQGFAQSSEDKAQFGETQDLSVQEMSHPEVVEDSLPQASALAGSSSPAARQVLESAMPSALVLHPQATKPTKITETTSVASESAAAIASYLVPLDSDATDVAAEPLAITFQPIAFQHQWVIQLELWKQQVLSLPRWIWGAMAGLIAVGSAGYMLSRPCVIGSCPRLTQAETLNQEAVDSLAARPAPGDVIEAHQDMQRATQLLATIPAWSRHHNAAQMSLTRYEDETAAIEQVIEAQQSATEAAEKSQNPPHPMPRWIEIRLLWQRAIAQLQQLPPDRQIQGFATEKLREYEANLADIDDRIAAEQTAERNLSGALEAGQLAKHYTENAQSSPGWQIAYREWENAVNFLQRIPQGTQAYTEAAPLLSDYRQHLQTARDRLQNEQQGDLAYSQAISAAQQARQYEQQSQWTLAVQQWRQALELAQQVPRDTTLATSAQALLDPYRNALAHATGQLREAMALQSLSQDLDRICGSTSLVCHYSIAANQLRITVNPGYDRAIEQTMTYAQPQQPDATFDQPARQLLQQIATLGSNSQRNIELYDVQGALIARYVPRYGGFIRN